jgi:hypothetical protein
MISARAFLATHYNMSFDSAASQAAGKGTASS